MRPPPCFTVCPRGDEQRSVAVETCSKVEKSRVFGLIRPEDVFTRVSSVPFGVLYRFPSLLLQYYGLFLVPGCNTTNKFTALDRASIFSRVSSTRCYLSSAFFFFFFLERTKKHLRLQSQRSGTRCRDGALAYEVITDRMFFPLAAFLFRFVLVGWMRKTAALSC